MRFSIIESLIKEISTYPKDVLISEREDEKGRLILIKVNQKDMKTFIGKQGYGIKSLRMIIKMIYKNEKTSLIIDEL